MGRRLTGRLLVGVALGAMLGWPAVSVFGLSQTCNAPATQQLFNPTAIVEQTPANQPFMFTVPAGVTRIVIDSVGAAGGGSGPGAEVAATFTVTPGQVLCVVVGAEGFGDEAVAAARLSIWAAIPAPSARRVPPTC